MIIITKNPILSINSGKIVGRQGDPQGYQICGFGGPALFSLSILVDFLYQFGKLLPKSQLLTNFK